LDRVGLVGISRHEDVGGNRGGRGDRTARRGDRPHDCRPAAGELAGKVEDQAGELGLSGIPGVVFHGNGPGGGCDGAGFRCLVGVALPLTALILLARGCGGSDVWGGGGLWKRKRRGCCGCGLHLALPEMTISGFLLGSGWTSVVMQAFFEIALLITTRLTTVCDATLVWNVQRV